METLRTLINSPHEEWPKFSGRRKKVVFEYMVTPELIKQMTGYTKLFKKTTVRGDIIQKPSTTVALIYVVINHRTKKFHVGYTTNKLFTFVKLNLHQRNMRNSNVFEYMGGRSVEGIVFRALEFYRFKNRGELNKRKEAIARRYEKQYVQGELPTQKGGQETRMELPRQVLQDFAHKLQPIKGYIYIIRHRDDGQCYIGYYHRQASLRRLLEVLANEPKLMEAVRKYGPDAFGLEYIEKQTVNSDLELMIRTDYYRLLNNSVGNGFNVKYEFMGSPTLFGDVFRDNQKRVVVKQLFAQIQWRVAERDFKDVQTPYGYVFEVKNRKTGQRYFDYAHGRSLREVALSLYETAAQCSKKAGKLHRALAYQPVGNFRWKIVRAKEMDNFNVRLADETQALIAKYRTVDRGYNEP